MVTLQNDLDLSTFCKTTKILVILQNIVGQFTKCPNSKQPDGKKVVKQLVYGTVVKQLVYGTCKLGRKHGLLQQVYIGNQFIPCLERFLSPDDVVPERKVSLREVALVESMGTRSGIR